MQQTSQHRDRRLNELDGTSAFLRAAVAKNVHFWTDYHPARL